MSAGKFETGKYEQSTGGNVWPCRAQIETKALTLGGTANAYPTEAVTSGLPRVRLRKGKKEFGVSIRTVTVELKAAGTGATSEYAAGTLHTIPVFQQSVHDGYSFGSLGTYLGIACECKGKFPQ